MTITEKERQIFKKILSCNNVQIIVHKSPDGDTLATAAALKHVYDKLGKRSEIVCNDDVSRRLSFIVENDKLKPTFKADFTVAVDVAAPELIGTELYSYLGEHVDFCIDHHFSNTGYADETILDGKASSAGEVLFELLRDSNIELDDCIAEKLYTAISFDTGCFKYSNTAPLTHRIAAELLEYKFDASMINARMFDFETLAQMKLETAAISKIKQYENGKITILTLTHQMVVESGIDEDEIDNLSSVARRVEGTAVSATLKEKSEGIVKISLRSNGDFDVSKVAAQFGGGGHMKASGCVIKGSAAEAEKQISEALCQAWKEFENK